MDCSELSRSPRLGGKSCAFYVPIRNPPAGSPWVARPADGRRNPGTAGKLAAELFTAYTWICFAPNSNAIPRNVPVLRPARDSHLSSLVPASRSQLADGFSPRSDSLRTRSVDVPNKATCSTSCPGYCSRFHHSRLLQCFVFLQNLLCHRVPAIDHLEHARRVLQPHTSPPVEQIYPPENKQSLLTFRS